MPWLFDKGEHKDAWKPEKICWESPAWDMPPHLHELRNREFAQLRYYQKDLSVSYDQIEMRAHNEGLWVSSFFALRFIACPSLALFLSQTNVLTLPSGLQLGWAVVGTGRVLEDRGRGLMVGFASFLSVSAVTSRSDWVPSLGPATTGKPFSPCYWYLHFCSSWQDGLDSLRPKVLLLFAQPWCDTSSCPCHTLGHLTISLGSLFLPIPK